MKYIREVFPLFKSGSERYILFTLIGAWNVQVILDVVGDNLGGESVRLHNFSVRTPCQLSHTFACVEALPSILLYPAHTRDNAGNTFKY